MESIQLLVLIFGFSYCLGYPNVGLDNSHFHIEDLELENVKNGSRYGFISIYDGSAITVQANGDVLSEDWTAKPEQKWLALIHPRDPDFFELRQEVVPYNMLSGFEDSELNPGLFPRFLSFYRNGEVWEIRIRTRWCLESNGRGWHLDIDDCEYFYAPWQLWKIIDVA